MKTKYTRKIFSLLLAILMVVAIVPFSAIHSFALEMAKQVTVVNGTTASTGNVDEGTTVTIEANPAPLGKMFYKWECLTDDVTLEFDDLTAETTTFTMPNKSVKVQAKYIDIPEITLLEYRMSLGAPSIGANVEHPKLYSVNGDPLLKKLIDLDFEEWQYCASDEDYKDENAISSYLEDRFVSGNQYGIWIDVITNISKFSKECKLVISTDDQSYTVERYSKIYDDEGNELPDDTQEDIVDMEFDYCFGVVDDKYSVSHVNFELSGYEEGKNITSLSVSVKQDNVSVGEQYLTDYTVFDSDGNALTSGIFEEGQTYGILINFKADNGSQLIFKADNVENFTIGNVCAMSISDNADGSHSAVFILPTLNMQGEAIESIALDLSGYEFGEPTSGVALALSQGTENVVLPNYEITKYDGGALPATFNESAHRLQVLLAPANVGHHLQDISCDNVTVNGLPAVGISRILLSGQALTMAYFDLPALAANDVGTVDFGIENYQDEKSTDSVEVEIKNAANAYIKDFAILDSEGNEYDGILAENTAYYLSVTLNPNNVPGTSFTFANLTKEKLTVDGDNCAIKISYNAVDNNLTAVFALESLAHIHNYGILFPEAPAVHTATELKAGMRSHYFCDACGTYFTAEKVATEEAALIIPAPTHSYTVENGYKGADGHANVCSCGAHETIVPHDDTNRDEKCDACNYDMPSKADTDLGTTPETGDPNTTDKKDGLGAGAVVGIVIGSAATLGGGGFALWWFVFRKKKLV